MSVTPFSDPDAPPAGVYDVHTPKRASCAASMSTTTAATVPANGIGEPTSVS
ncbi:hypothetical protein C6A86_007320 [Mycobacterium sp. ITM-2016-00316]|uniref:hypothetical protein n=1 Tax=Mycobacterium sp. ITM-2016-00316 TaxID=2099695 RepID=UPI001304F6AB|nr:hypothetical protein [Mycobacterium sp. ITM-2016-00316]WNG83464.1 hypothetical protein C6A86_007320 [Mycobacterium sp. ITM-2016-00316]